MSWITPGVKLRAMWWAASEENGNQKEGNKIMHKKTWFTPEIVSDLQPLKIKTIKNMLWVKHRLEMQEKALVK